MSIVATAANKARGLYLGYYMAYGALLPFLNLYFRRIGMDGVQIGALTAIPVLATTLGALVWSLIADSFHLQAWILRMAFLISPLTVLMMTRSTSFAGLLALGVAFGFFTSPIVPILDSSAIEIVKVSRVSYGGMRVWGSIGWTLSAWLVGLIQEKAGMHTFFYAYAVLMGLTFLFLLMQEQAASARESFVRPNITSLLTFDVGSFIFSVFLVGTSMGAVSAFFSIYMDQIGATEGSIGLAWALSSLSEIPIFWFSGVILRRVGVTRLLEFAYMIYGARWMLLSFITVPWLALLTQLLNGLSFAIFLAAGVTHINNLAPQGMNTTVQALLTTTYFSVGSICGAMVGGFLFDQIGSLWLFRVSAALAVGGLLVFNLARVYRKGVAQTS